MGLGIQTIYKWVNDKNCTDSYDGDTKYCTFGRDKMVQKPVQKSGEYRLCSHDVIHAFGTMTQAFMHRGSLVSSNYTKLWQGLGNIVAADHTKVGCQWVKLTKLVELPAFARSNYDYKVGSRHYIGVLAAALQIPRPTSMDEMGFFYRQVFDEIHYNSKRAKIPQHYRLNLSNVCTNAQYTLESLFRFELMGPKYFGQVTPRILEYESKHKMPLVES